MKSVSERLNIKNMEDWYKVSLKDITNCGGSTLVNMYESHIKLIENVYPNYNWLPWKFNSVPNGYWEDRNNVIKYMNWLSNELHVNKYEDWYNVKYEDIVNNHGISILSQFQNSHIKLITAIYNNYDWLPWKFNSVPKRYWEDKNNVIKYMNWLSNELHINKYEDWYNVSREDILNKYGNSLLGMYNNSHIKLITTIYNDYDWLPWMFKSSPRKYWEDKNNVVKYMNWLANKLNINKNEDWYKVTQQDIINNYGSGLIKKYNYSPTKLIVNTIDNYKWDLFKFNSLPQGYLKLIQNDNDFVKYFVDYFIDKFKITKTEDWYLIGDNQIKESVSLKITDFMIIVKQFYPDLNLKKFQYGNPLSYKKSQYMLNSVLQSIFPNIEIIEEYRHPNLNNLEFDYYLPLLNIAFEYQVRYLFINFKIKPN